MTSVLSLRTLALAAAVACASGTLAAQISCYESNFGTALGSGDDSVFAIQPLGFAFPFAGQTYTDVHVTTNGLLYLSNAGTPAPGTHNGGSYSPTGSTLVAAAAPAIAPWWHDLNVVSPNAVHINQLSGPNRTVITWDHCVEYSYSNQVTVQCQLYASGEIVFFYSANTAVASGNNCIVGFSPGGSVANPGGVDLSGNPSTTGSTVYELFHSGTFPFDIQGRATIFTPNAAGGYDVDTNTCVSSAHTSYGAGCVSLATSFYEQFGANSFDLGVAAPASNSVLMTPAGGGYLVTPGSANWFTHTTAGLGLGDDAQAPLALPTPFTYPGGSTSTLGICSNGFIWLQPDVSNDYSPSTGELLSQTPRLAPAWVDMVPDSSNDVYAEVDAVNNIAYVTWDSVATYASGGSVRMQAAIDLNNMTVEYRYQDCTVPSAAAIVGWSIGGGAHDPAARDLTLSMPFVTPMETSALALGASPSPVLGSNVTWTTANIPAAAVLSAQFLSFGAIAPGLDLGLFGAPGCLQHIDPSLGAGVLLAGSPTATFQAMIPNAVAWLGTHVYSQSVTLVPGINALGLITSNGLDSRISAF